MATILIIDDSKTERELMIKVITASGHVAEQAVDGDEGFTKAKSLKPALILLDVVMPKKDGFATCRQIKKEPETQHIPVVMITSKGQDSDKFWGQRQGCDGYIVKPYNPQDVANIIKRFVP